MEKFVFSFNMMFIQKTRSLEVTGAPVDQSYFFRTMVIFLLSFESTGGFARLSLPSTAMFGLELLPKLYRGSQQVVWKYAAFVLDPS